MGAVALSLRKVHISTHFWIFLANMEFFGKETKQNAWCGREGKQPDQALEASPQMKFETDENRYKMKLNKLRKNTRNPKPPLI